MKTIVRTLLALVAGAVTLIAGLFVAARGDYPVAALVTGDAALPSLVIAGVRLHLRIAPGPAGAPAIVVLHGGPGGDFRSLQALSALSDSYTVVFYDQRGAGLSTRVPAGHLTLSGYLDELEAVIASVSPERPVILIGHSWGAMLATAYLGQAPHRVARAVLIEPGYLDSAGRADWERRSRSYMSGPGYALAALRAGLRAAHVSGPGGQARDDYLIGQMVGVFASHPQNPYHCGAGYRAPGWRFGALASSVARAAPGSETDRIARGTAYPGPVLLLAGACNDWTGAGLQARHAARFANARLEVIPEAGHDVIWDNPAVTLTALRRFLSSTEANGAMARRP